MVSLCKIKKSISVVESDAEMPGIGRNAVTSTVRWDIKRRGGCSDSDNKLPFSIIFCTSLIKIQLLPRVWSCYHQ